MAYNVQRRIIIAHLDAFGSGLPTIYLNILVVQIFKGKFHAYIILKSFLSGLQCIDYGTQESFATFIQSFNWFC